MYLHVSRYLYDFLLASGEGYCSTIQIKSFIEETGGITTITVISVEAAVRRRCRRRYISECIWILLRFFVGL
jgi:hypothetical protein